VFEVRPVNAEPELEPVREEENWRLTELFKAGYDAHSAEIIARRPDIDLHQAVELVKKGCTVDVALRILL
jgi:hypothetical protein